jgi:hypothetical protein
VTQAMLGTPEQVAARAVYRSGAKRRFHVVGVVVLVGWLVMLWVLVREHSTGFGELSIGVSAAELDAGFREGFIYYGVYAGKGRAGTLYTEQRRLADGGYSVRSTMELAMSVAGTQGTSKTDIEMRLDPEFRLRAFEASLQGTGLTGKANGEWVAGEGLQVTVEALGLGQQTQMLKMSEPPLVQHTLRAALVRRGLEKGERVSVEIFSPDVLGQGSVAVDITYRGRAEINVGGQTLDAFHFEEASNGIVQHVYVNELGEVLQEEMPMGMVLVREAEAEAKQAVLEPMSLPIGDILKLGGKRFGGSGLNFLNGAEPPKEP